MPKVIPGRVTWLSRLPKETNDAHLFAQSAHAPDQTDTRPQLLHCPDDLTARLCHDARFFMKFRGPKAHPNRHQFPAQFAGIWLSAPGFAQRDRPPVRRVLKTVKHPLGLAVAW